MGVISPETLKTLVAPDTNSIIEQGKDSVVWRLKLPGGESAVGKIYRRRGWVSRFRGGAFPFRVQREYNGLCVLADSGIPCSAPLLWGQGFAAEHARFEILVTREIPDVMNLSALTAAGMRKPSTNDLLPLFDVLRRMHQCGVYHGALWPKNIMMTTAPERERAFHVIDLARTIRFPSDITGTTMARFDLLSLLYGLGRRCPEFDAETALRRYGYAPEEAREIAEQARRYRSTRHLRNRLGLTFKIRSLLANLSAALSR